MTAAVTGQLGRGEMHQELSTSFEQTKLLINTGEQKGEKQEETSILKAEDRSSEEFRTFAHATYDDVPDDERLPTNQDPVEFDAPADERHADAGTLALEPDVSLHHSPTILVMPFDEDLPLDEAREILKLSSSQEYTTPPSKVGSHVTSLQHEQNFIGTVGNSSGPFDNVMGVNVVKGKFSSMIANSGPGFEVPEILPVNPSVSEDDLERVNPLQTQATSLPSDWNVASTMEDSPMDEANATRLERNVGSQQWKRYADPPISDVVGSLFGQIDSQMSLEGDRYSLERGPSPSSRDFEGTEQPHIKVADLQDGDCVLSDTIINDVRVDATAAMVKAKVDQSAAAARSSEQPSIESTLALDYDAPFVREVGGSDFRQRDAAGEMIHLDCDRMSIHPNLSSLSDRSTDKILSATESLPVVHESGVTKEVSQSKVDTLTIEPPNSCESGQTEFVSPQRLKFNSLYVSTEQDSESGESPVESKDAEADNCVLSSREEHLL
jgi:hypothetical protein